MKLQTLRVDCFDEKKWSFNYGRYSFLFYCTICEHDLFMFPRRTVIVLLEYNASNFVSFDDGKSWIEIDLSLEVIKDMRLKLVNSVSDLTDKEYVNDLVGVVKRLTEEIDNRSNEQTKQIIR